MGRLRGRPETGFRSAGLAAACILAMTCPGCDRPPAPRDAAALDPGVEAISFLGRPLRPPEPSDEFRAEQEARLAEARAALAIDPGDAEARIWAGRRTAYLGRYREAIEIFEEGVARHPEDARFHRHLGHRLITLRDPRKASAVLRRAAELRRGLPDEIEPDGLPNPRNIPTSTLHSNIHYHLGLAHYLAGEYERAAEAYRECLRWSVNPDMLSATTHWLYMTLRRLGRDGEAEELLAPIRADMDIIENHAYHRLLLMYRGERTADELLAAAEGEEAVGFATTAYGVGNWYLSRGERERALEIFRRIVDTEPWAAFGYIAAEADLARMGRR